MEFLFGLLFVIFAVVILKELFKKKNPIAKGRSIVGLFVAPILQIAYSAWLWYDANHLKILDSQDGWGSVLSLVNKLKEGSVESEYYEAAANYVGVANISFIITLFSAGFLIYKIFDDGKCNTILMHLLVGVGLIGCMASTYMSGLYFSSAMKYIFLSQDGKTPLYAMGAVMAILIWAWFYFHVSLKDILSISSCGEPIKTSKQEKSINDDKIQMLTQLKNLFDSGILTQEEFDKQKKEILNS